jgi:hypothetical protein
MNNINILKEIEDRLFCLIQCLLITALMPIIMIMFLIRGKRMYVGINLPEGRLFDNLEEDYLD